MAAGRKFYRQTMAEPTDSGRSTDADLPDDVVDDLVEAPRRRALLRHLAECSEPVTLTDLAAALGAAEAGTEPAEVSRESRRAVREDIFQEDLPKLTATGVVEYDSMRGTISLRGERVAERVT